MCAEWYAQAMCCSIHSLYTFLQVGDQVDARDLRCGAWFEAKIQRVTRGNGQSTASQGETSSDSSSTTESAATANGGDSADIFYHVHFDG